MIAGEFAVLERNYPLLVMAVDRYVYCTINDAEANKLSLIDFGMNDLSWDYGRDGVRFAREDSRLAFVQAALFTTITYLKEQSIKLHPFALTIKSELDDQATGAKYGLGSSAAVVTGVVTAVLTKFLKGTPAPELIFKLSSISHVQTQGSGSGADIAASTYGGVLLYTSFQADWLLQKLQQHHTLTSVVEQEWEYLLIERTAFPEAIQLCIGWTGNPASTKNLVAQIATLQETSPAKYEAFLEASKQAVAQILSGIKHQSHRDFFTGIMKNREALAQLGKDANVEIETEKLHKLSMEAKRLGGAGKLSGAGGGDCGIAFLPANTDCTALLEAWTDAGIQPLSLKVSPLGAQRN